MGSAEYTEHAGVQEEELRCWRCGTRNGARKLINGAILCPSCEQVMKP